MKSSSPIKKKLKRKRSHNSNNESIFSFRDELREKEDDIQQKESQLVKYEDEIEKLKAENNDLLVNIKICIY
jgi:hypothetical protein